LIIPEPRQKGFEAFGECASGKYKSQVEISNHESLTGIALRNNPKPAVQGCRCACVSVKVSGKSHQNFCGGET
jgi:hypothetical protein